MMKTLPPGESFAFFGCGAGGLVGQAIVKVGPQQLPGTGDPVGQYCEVDGWLAELLFQHELEVGAIDEDCAAAHGPAAPADQTKRRCSHRPQRLFMLT